MNEEYHATGKMPKSMTWSMSFMCDRELVNVDRPVSSPSAVDSSYILFTKAAKSV